MVVRIRIAGQVGIDSAQLGQMLFFPEKVDQDRSALARRSIAGRSIDNNLILDVECGRVIGGLGLSDLSVTAYSMS